MSSIVVGTAMVDGGSATLAGSVIVTAGTGGLSSEISIPTALAGASAIFQGASFATQGTKNFAEQKDRGGSFNAGKDTDNKTSREALRNAKDQNGVPRSQQPNKTTSVQDKNTGQPLKQYEYTNYKGEKISIRRDIPVTYRDGGKQGKHYNAGKANDPKLKQHHDYKK